MSRLTHQEQFALWILLALIVAGGFGRWHLRQQPPANIPPAAIHPSPAAPTS